MLRRPVRSSARLAALSLGVALSVACSAEAVNAAPIIDSVDSPLVVKERDGVYEIPITILFHDSDSEAVTALRYRLSPPDVSGTVDVSPPNPTRQSAHVTIVIPVEVLASDSLDAHDKDRKNDKDDKKRGKGNAEPRTLEITVVDSRGAESLAMYRPITLD